MEVDHPATAAAAAGGLEIPAAVLARSFNDFFDYVAAPEGGYSCLGAGNFGSVFVCKRKADPSVAAVGAIPETFAVKHIRTPAIGLRQVFARDVGLMARLNAAVGHPHIIRFVDAFLADEGGDKIVSVVMEMSPIAVPFPVMPAVATLGGLMRAANVAVAAGREANCDLTKSGVVTPPVSLTAAKSIMKQMLSAVQYMHAAGLVHRDIKPDNVLVFGSAVVAGEVVPNCKISDFGLSREAAVDMTSNTGTKAFMAPEQSTTHYDGKVDVFGVGTTLYAIVACHHPFADVRRIRMGFPDRFHPTMLGRFFPPGSLQHDFLKALTQTDPAARLDAATALAHPFLADAVDPWMAA